MLEVADKSCSRQRCRSRFDAGVRDEVGSFVDSDESLQKHPELVMGSNQWRGDIALNTSL